MSDFDRCLEQLACSPILLVASDYDGTIAPIVSDPAEARPCREAIVALRTMAALPQTHVAVISGRALRDLAELSGLPEEVHLVGSHGSEFEPDFARSLPAETKALRERIRGELEAVAAAGEGFLVEAKPASVAFHYRNAGDAEAQQALRAVLDGPAALEGVYPKHGKKVLELGVVSTSKGDALERIRHRCGASAVIFFGDDVTDEDAFATLTGPDVAIKVGEGDSQATHRVAGPIEVAEVLARLCELRAAWLAGADATPIEAHSILSDQRTTALVTPGGGVTWLCAPRLDSSALFAQLLGGPAAGHFTIRDGGGAPPVEQRYMGDTLILESRYGGFTVRDFMDCSGGRPSRRAGRCELIRLVEGRGRVAIEFAPRLDFGRAPTKIAVREGGLEIEDTLDPIVLRSDGVSWEIVSEGPHQTARATVELTREPLALELRYGTGSLRDGATVAERLRQTDRYWASWAEGLVVPDVAPDVVRRSALILKGLCYGPTGAIAAAATTSLPEHVGGVRNWDYRYCWLRDGAMTATTLAKLGSMTEAMEFLDWVLGVVDGCEAPDRLQPLYTVRGETLGPEAEIGELSGYRGSRPVRVGNAASRQIQIDVFGEIVELVALLAALDAPLSVQHWRLVEAMVQAVERRWSSPDHGIWEIRKPRRHHVHSKVMCWLAVDRAIATARFFMEQERDDWTALRDRIADDVLEFGYKPQVNAFTAAYDDVDLDASALFVGLSGLVLPDDPRFAGTVAAVETALKSGPTVYRYRADDGLPGFEGGFHICTSWLIDAYVLMGRRDDAQGLFEQLLELVGPTGTLSEQYGPATRRALGNVPQAYSHLGLIENALHLAGASQ